MTINLIDARRGLHNKCLELFADKKIAEQIYCYLCDGIEDCEEADRKHGHWIDTGSGQECSVCSEIQYGYDSYRNYCANCGTKMDEVENG